MPSYDLPEFSEATLMTEGVLLTDELSESHGLACGLLCAQPELPFETCFKAMQAQELVSDQNLRIKGFFEQLFEVSKYQLSDPECIFTLWLPSDQDSLSERSTALAAWCAGFLTGLSQIFGDRLLDLTPEVSEIVRDFSEISRTARVSGVEEEGEEGALVEVQEFVRIAVLLLREELRGPEGYESVH